MTSTRSVKVPVTPPQITVLWPEADVQDRIAELGKEVSERLGGGSLVCLVVLGGGFFFAADLIRSLKGFDKIEIEYIKLSSYDGTTSTGRVKFHTEFPNLAGRKVLVIEDLLDSGLTMSSLRKELAERGVGNVHYALLIDKPARRKVDFKPDFVGFACETDAYLVGCGMDLHQGLRELPYIGAIQDDPDE